MTRVTVRGGGLSPVHGPPHKRHRKCVHQEIPVVVVLGILLAILVGLVGPGGRRVHVPSIMQVYQCVAEVEPGLGTVPLPVLLPTLLLRLA